MDVVDRVVEKLDETGIRLVKRVAGVVVFQLEHTWSARSLHDGRRGALPPARGTQPRGMPTVPDKVKHNIEEVGQLEHLLPQLKSSGEAEPAQRA